MADTSTGERPPRSTFVLLALVTGAIVANINLSVANVALPTIGAELGASQDQLTAIANAFALGLASTVLYLGSIGDRYGRKLLFVAGAVLTVPMAMLAAWARLPRSSRSRASAAASPPRCCSRRRCRSSPRSTVVGPA